MLRRFCRRSGYWFVTVTFLAFCSAYTGSANAEVSPLWKKVEGWDVRVDVSLDDSCFIFRVYEGMTILRAGFNKISGDSYLMLGNKDWLSLEAGKTYDLILQFDHEEPWLGEATGIDFYTLVGLWMNIDKAAFFREMAEKHVLSISYRGTSIARLSLDGSYAALQEMVNCQKLVNEAQGDSDPFDSSSDGIESDPFVL